MYALAYVLEVEVAVVVNVDNRGWLTRHDAPTAQVQRWLQDKQKSTAQAQAVMAAQRGPCPRAGGVRRRAPTEFRTQGLTKMERSVYLFSSYASDKGVLTPYLCSRDR